MTKKPLLQIKNLHKSFGHNHVLRGVNIDLYPQNSLAILGASGSGKSVLLKIILGLLLPDQGSLFFKGQPFSPSSQKDTQQLYAQCGVLFQHSALFDSLPIWHNISFSLIMNHQVSTSHAKDKALSLLEDVGLDASCADLFPSELSGGMRKRVGLARALATNPDILFCDEPTTGLDPIMSHTIDHLIHSLALKHNTTVLSITHNMATLPHLATHVAMLFQGHIIWNDTIDTLYTNDNPILQQFVKGEREGPFSSPSSPITTASTTP